MNEQTVTVSEHWQGISRGDTITVKGERGQFTFIRHVHSEHGEWVDCYGGARKQWRSFPPQLVRKVRTPRRHTTKDTK
jgi:hypothetical protein